MGPVRQGEAIAPCGFGPFDADAVAAYALASADDNPLHRDAALAARAGLARPPVHGMLVVGCFEPYLAAWRPNAIVRKIGCKFIRPVLVGEGVVVSGKVVRVSPDGAAVLRLSVKREGGTDLVCMAEVFLEAKSPRSRVPRSRAS